MAISEDSILHESRARHLKFIFILVACGLDIIALGSMVVLVADVQERFGITATESGWTLTSYVIAFAGFIAFFGRVGDIMGNGVMMCVSTVLFAVWSLLCAVVPNYEAFAVFRALQGMAGAGIVPASYALVARMFNGPDIQRYFSILSCILSGMSGVGFIVGGAFGETKLGYKSLFYFLFGASLVPAAVTGVLIGYPEYLRDRHLYRQRFREVLKLDVIGCLLFISGSVLLVVGLTQGGDYWNQPSAYVTLAIGLVLLLSFFTWNIGYSTVLKLLKPISSKRTYNYFENVHLLMPKELLLAHNFFAVLMVVFFLFGGFIGVAYVTVNYSQGVEETSVIIASIKILPLIVGLIAANATIAINQTILTPKNGLIVGTVLSALGAVFLIPLKHVEMNVYWKLFFLAALFTGVGGAVMFSYMLSIAIGDAPDEFKGLAAGIVQTAGQFGTELALSIIVSLLGNNRANRTELINKYQNCGYYIFASCALSAILSVLLLKNSVPQPSDIEQQPKLAEDTADSTNSNDNDELDAVYRVTCEEKEVKEGM